MKRTVTLLVCLGVLGSAALGSDFKLIKKMSNAKLQKVVDVMAKFQGDTVRDGGYAVTRRTSASGRSQAELRLAILKETLHRYSGAMLDDGIRLALVPAKPEGASAAIKDLTDFEDDESMPYKDLEAALKVAVADKSLAVYSGDGSGNNTMAAFVCVFDKTNDEVAFLILSNFGSDN